MKKFKEITNEQHKVFEIETGLYGKFLLSTPELNKGSAFPQEEREQFGLIGKLPCHIETLDEQVARYYEEYRLLPLDLAKNKYLNSIRQSNHIAFFELVSRHLEEMLPIVYTPTIGDAVKRYSYQFNTPSGVHFSYPNVNSGNIDSILNSISYPELDIVVVTDGEGILGIGDWGAGGMDICVGKAIVYTLCGGINPRRILPIQIDVGTNNKQLLNDPMYLGWRHPRIEGDEYHAFVGMVLKAVIKRFPSVFVHWEDLSAINSRAILAKYRDKLCTFNDDVQGTGATALASVYAALNVTRQPLSEQRIIVFGAGSAGVGIVDQIFLALKHEGLSDEEAARCFWLVDKDGLLVDGMDYVLEFQQRYARPKAEFSALPDAIPSGLLEIVHHVKPTILIGCSAVAGAFTKEVVMAMHEYVKRPVILPLSNPTCRSEVTPQEVFEWTQGEALIATGSPYDPVTFNGENYRISQCNNAFIFPGLGLGIIASGATRVTDYMLIQAACALADCSPLLHDPNGALLPAFKASHVVSKSVALAVAKAACEEGVARLTDEAQYASRIEALFWQPDYLPYRLSSHRVGLEFKDGE